MGETKFLLYKNKVKLIYPFDTPLEQTDTYSGNWSDLVLDTGTTSIAAAKDFNAMESDEDGALPDVTAIVWTKAAHTNDIAIVTYRPVIGTENQIRLYKFAC